MDITKPVIITGWIVDMLQCTKKFLYYYTRHAVHQHHPFQLFLGGGGQRGNREYLKRKVSCMNKIDARITQATLNAQTNLT